MPKNNIWEITASVSTKFTVIFDEEITPDEARVRFLEEMYDDIIDEEIVQVGHVISVA